MAKVQSSVKNDYAKQKNREVSVGTIPATETLMEVVPQITM